MAAHKNWMPPRNILNIISGMQLVSFWGIIVARQLAPAVVDLAAPPLEEVVAAELGRGEELPVADLAVEPTLGDVVVVRAPVVLGLVLR